MKYLIIALLSTFGNAAYADGIALSLGAGKMLNNTNTRLPGYVVAARGTLSKGYWSADVAYTYMGKSFLGDNAAITTIGVAYGSGRLHYGASLITGASYAVGVTWDSEHPDNDRCAIEGCGHHYENNGHTFSRACHLCGGTISAEYSLTNHLNLRGEYYGLRHMEPTYQGVMIQLTYSFGVL